MVARQKTKKAPKKAKHSWPFKFDLRDRKDGKLLARAEVDYDGTVSLKEYGKRAHTPLAAVREALNQVRDVDTVLPGEHDDRSRAHETYEDKKMELILASARNWESSGELPEQAKKAKDAPVLLTAEERKLWDKVVFGDEDTGPMLIGPFGAIGGGRSPSVGGVVTRADDLIRARRMRTKR